MQITVNGNPTEVAEGTNMAGLVEELALGDQRIEVEVNEELVPRSRLDRFRLAAHDWM